MLSHHVEYRRYLCLGTISVGLCFPDDNFAEQACQHIFLSNQCNGRVIADLDYTLDDTIGSQLSQPGHPNVVGINKQKMANGVNRLYLRMFDQFTVALDFYDDSIQIRYPSHAPIRLLMDDVLQAALQPVLERVGGFILHGACMVRSKRAIVFMGNSGAGKSTTAYNLTRFGFDCYADDAVLVTPCDHHLFVWPLSREFSLRPLSFKLFKEQGVCLGTYKKDGDKYYFRQTADCLPGAQLKHICFLELSGEEKTTVTQLTDEQTLTILSQNKRHFSFMGRSEAYKYSRILAKQTPASIMGRVGTHLDYQGGVFDAICSGKASDKNDHRSRCGVLTRKEKLDLIRHAWMQSGNLKLADVIPFIGDYDPKVFALALGLFQTLPSAKLHAISSPISIPGPDMTTFASWVDVHDWLKGCEALLKTSAFAVLQQFALSWIASAPIIYSFLKVLSFGDPDRIGLVDAAWNKYFKKNSSSNNVKIRHSIVGHDENWLAWPNLSPDERLCIWVSVDGVTHWERLAEQISTVGNNSPVTLIPIIGNDPQLGDIVALFRYLCRRGVVVKIHRNLPLCGLTKETACYLLASNGFDDGPDTKATSDKLYSILKNGFVCDTLDFNGDTADTGIRLALVEKPFENCSHCSLFPLGLCRGGIFNPPQP